MTLLAILLSVLVGAQDATPPLSRVLTFEVEHSGGSPAGWSVNTPASAFADDKVVRGGKWSARIERSATTGGEVTTLTKTIPLDVAGKTIVLRGFLRTEDVTGFVALWLREDSSAGSSLAFNSTQDRQVKGSNDWQEHSVTVPIQAEGRKLVFGVVFSGTGKVWADDLELLVDGAPFESAPKVERPKTVLDTDREFDGGSRIAIDTLNAVQIDNLITLGRVWGFLKYHHPAITSGSRHWDYDLFRVLPGVLAAGDQAAANAVLVKWITSLGPVNDCKPCASVNASTLHFGADLGWVDDRSRLNPELSLMLRAIHANRPSTSAQFFVSMIPGIGNPSFDREPAYAAVKLPDPGYQLLALYRLWNIVQYWFPYRDVIEGSWHDVLRDSIAPVATAKTPPEYQRQLMKVIARIADTHANLWSSLAARPPVGDCRLPIDVRFIEGRAVVTQSGGPFETGDVLSALDAVPVTKLVQDWSPYYAASNEPTRLRDIGRSMTRGNCGDTTASVIRGSETLTLNVTRVAPAVAGAITTTHDLPGETFRKLSDDVAYLKLSSIKSPDVAGYLKSAAGTKGLIIDIRNYPSAFVVFELGQHIVGDVTAFARFTGGDLTNPGAFHWGPVVSLKPSSTPYAGKIVILIDEVSQSQAEYTTMAFRAGRGARVVGSTTAGADGNVSAIPLPGGMRSMISGIGVFYPDKRPTQRIGIIPDVEVRPTIAGIRAGRDEVLEAGIREIVGANVPLSEIQKLIPPRGR